MRSYEELINLLPQSKEEAVHASYLAERMNKDVRTVKQIVHDARWAGYAILSAACGYWLSLDEREKDIFLRMQLANAGTRVSIAEAVKRSSLTNDRRSKEQ